jgi:hypothetical protein
MHDLGLWGAGLSLTMEGATADDVLPEIRPHGSDPVTIYPADLEALARELRATADTLDVLATAGPCSYHFPDDAIVVQLARLFLGLDR